MGIFQYQAVDSQGATRKGFIDADSEKHARELIRQKGLWPQSLSVSTKSSLANKSSLNHFSSSKSYKQCSYSNSRLSLSFFSKRTKLTVKELALLTRQLATLLAAGLPLEETLLAVSEQTEKPNAKRLLLAMRSKVQEGHSFSASLRDFPESFSHLYCATINAGERGGHLDIVLQRLADYSEKQYAMRQKITNALIYPGIMILVSISIVGFLLEYVVPKMVSVYSNVNQALPMMTQVLIFISAQLAAYGFYGVIIIALGLFYLRYHYKKHFPFREKIHYSFLKIPLFGYSIKLINTARFARTFAILSTAGVSVLEAMSISATLITNIPIRKAVEVGINHIREGANIHLALKQTNYFPPMSIHLIASGEASGQLENMLERAANNQDNEIAGQIETYLALFEPAIILIMGAIVLFIVLAVLLPIFQLDQMLD